MIVVKAKVEQIRYDLWADSAQNRGKQKEDTQMSVFFSCWRYLSFRAVSSQVLSAEASLTSVFGMGTGGPSP